MSDDPLDDQAHRDRFQREWAQNFAVSANAGSGKTTAISQRLAEIALREDGGAVLQKTAVVTFTNKAAGQIGQRARGVLLQRLLAEGRKDLAPLDNLERAFFGTIHSFCLKLAQTYGQDLGVNLNPTVLTEEESAASWEEFLEQDAMIFSAATKTEVAAFLRHLPLAAIFELAKEMDTVTAQRLRARTSRLPPGPDETGLTEILAVAPVQKRSIAAVQTNQRFAAEWVRRYHEESAFLPMAKPQGAAGGMPDLFNRLYAPMKAWLAEVAAALAAELADRYREWRFARGVQTYADQIDAAMAVLQNPATLDLIRGEGWRIILDEAQDTDPQQFAVLVEVARAPGSPIGTWPGDSGGPRPGHFCMVGDGQQSIYGSRADIGNFLRHLQAFKHGQGGQLLNFQVTFRAPRQVVALLNESLAPAFGDGRDFNLGLSPEEGAPPPRLQVPYVALVAGPRNEEGRVGRIPLTIPENSPANVDGWMAEEARQLAAFLAEHGPSSVGASHWGDVVVLAPRNDWLITVRQAFEAAGLKVALQMRKNRNGDNPAYAWITGLLAAICDPDNTFEWVGVLREIFTVSDAMIAAELREKGGFKWEEPDVHLAPLASALAVLRPLVMTAHDEGIALDQFVNELVSGCGLREKAAAIDSSGGVSAELDRLVAQAASLGLEGGGARDWLANLLGELEAGRPSGKPAEDAINILTAHSAKGLEWPTVIPVGMWRGLLPFSEQGLRVVKDQVHGPKVFFDGDSLPAETKEARDRERRRELVRLLYVTLTRPRTALMIPWVGGFGGKVRGESLAELWGADLAALPEIGPVEASSTDELAVEIEVAEVGAPHGKSQARPPLPSRVLPHQLAHQPTDWVRGSRHDSGLEEPLPAKPGLDPIDYGIWWHETLEFVPWGASDEEVDAYADSALVRASAQGFAERGREEWTTLRTSEAWSWLREARWTRSAELNVFAPTSSDQWIDGVMDLVLADATAAEVWVVDWKTNRTRPGESREAHIARLVGDYRAQLEAYGRCLESMFPSHRVRRYLYASVSGAMGEVVGV